MKGIQSVRVMCKSINSNVVIGNFLIEAVTRDKKYVSYEELISFDDLISEKLNEINYITKFSVNQIFDFEDDYPFFIESIKDEKIYIYLEHKDITINRLQRYFRMGLPSVILDELANTSSEVLD